MKKIIDKFPNYEVYSDGRIKNILRNKFIKGSLVIGYRYVLLRNGSIKKHCAIHRLVAMAFIDNPENLPLINHKNEKRDDNRVSNLEWCTHKYNIRYSMARAVGVYDLTGALINKYDTLTEACKGEDVNMSYASRCCNNKIESYKGLVVNFL